MKQRAKPALWADRPMDKGMSKHPMMNVEKMHEKKTVTTQLMTGYGAKNYIKVK